MDSTGSERKPKGDDLPYLQLPLLPAAQGFGFLKGLRVVDLTGSVAGPYATMLLADFGADVIKVERPQGDDARAWGPPFLNGEALWFASVNRNKRSIVMDIGSDEGRKDLEALIASADVLVTNQTPDVQKKLRLDYDSLKALRPDLVFVSITGFGLTGERKDLTCYDLIAEGYSGVMDITGAADSAPQKIGAPAADMLAGQDAAMACMAVLVDRKSSGKGALIDISLVESMTRFLSCRISSYFGSGEVPTRTGGTDSVIAIYQPFETADLPLNLGLGSDAIWKRFWSILGDEAFGARPEFGSNILRRENRPEIVAKIAQILVTQPRAEWLRRFAGARIPAGPINRVDEVAHDAALQERGLFYALQDGPDRVVPQIGLGIRIDDKPAVPHSAPPRLGQHSDEILKEIGRR